MNFSVSLLQMLKMWQIINQLNKILALHLFVSLLCIYFLNLCFYSVLQVMAVAPRCSAPAVGLCPLWVIQGHTLTTVCVSGKSLCPLERGSTFGSLCWTLKMATAGSTTSASSMALDQKGVRWVREPSGHRILSVKGHQFSKTNAPISSAHTWLVYSAALFPPVSCVKTSSNVMSLHGVWLGCSSFYNWRVLQVLIGAY